MKHEHTLVVIALMAFLFFASWLMGTGFTGLYLLDWEQNYCTQDFDCETGEVCCEFFGGQSGACDTEDKCQAIYRLSLEIGSQTSSLTKEQSEISLSNLEQPRSAATNTAFIFMGLILFILVLISFAHIHPKNKKTVKVLSIKKKPKKKKKKK